jgi:ElaB/YqjD/DUF883 family membrane-anchored ribosome-binding protein
MSDSKENVITLLDSDLLEIETALKDRPLRIALPLLQKIDSQLRAAAAKADSEAAKIKAEAESELETLRKKLESYEASAKAGIVHVWEEVKAAV